MVSCGYFLSSACRYVSKRVNYGRRRGHERLLTLAWDRRRGLRCITRVDGGRDDTLSETRQRENHLHEQRLLADRDGSRKKGQPGTGEDNSHGRQRDRFQEH